MTEADRKSEHKSGLYARLLEARVIQTLAIYVPVGWLLTEIVASATETFGLPDWMAGGAMALLIAGIPGRQPDLGSDGDLVPQLIGRATQERSDHRVDAS